MACFPRTVLQVRSRPQTRHSSCADRFRRGAEAQSPESPAANRWLHIGDEKRQLRSVKQESFWSNAITRLSLVKPYSDCQPIKRSVMN